VYLFDRSENISTLPIITYIGSTRMYSALDMVKYTFK
jgi:hypothetical protein